jgi:ATP-binding cassette, subfamily G (WHITE), member 2, PDR
MADPPGDQSDAEHDHDHATRHSSCNDELKDLQITKVQEQSQPRDRGTTVLFKNLTVYGNAKTVNIQQTAFTVVQIPFRKLFRLERSAERKQILHDLSGLVKKGELLAVLGRPGSGCSTFLKTISGDHNGLLLDQDAVVSFNGIPQKEMRTRFRGDVNYNPEIDRHFPHLTVGQTLHFAAALRTPRTRPENVTRDEYAAQTTDEILATYGLSHTKGTKVGNELVRGVSGGERKRVSLAEMHLSGCSVACWDQGTNGLDSAAALNFILNLKEAARATGSTHMASLYQASDAMLLEFDKILVLYEGHEVYFGPVSKAKHYFEEMGWFCPSRQPTADFLTACTNPIERRPRNGSEDRVPRTPEDFVRLWQESKEHNALELDISDYETEYPLDGQPKFVADLEKTNQAKKSRHISRRSPYLASTRKQIRYCTIRAWQRILGDKTATLAQTWGQIVMSLIIGSMFYQTRDNTDGLFSKGGVLFGAIMLNAIVTITEIFNLYDQRPIVEKHASYALYKPWTEALSGLVIAFPLKIITASTFNIILYFLANLRREPSNFFIFYLFCYVVTFVMGLIFRTIGASTSVIPEAFVVVGVVLPLLIVYTGFVIPKPSMHVWFKWITYINPVGYAFESLIMNEFHGRNFTCTPQNIVPPYAKMMNGSFTCSVPGSVENEPYVNGDAYTYFNYDYKYTHLWRNLGFLFAFLVLFLVVYLAISDRNMYSPPSTDTLVFRHGKKPVTSVQQSEPAESRVRSRGELQPHTKTFAWQNICYDIPVKDGTRRLLSDVSGWVKPGTLTALMVCALVLRG